MKKKLNVLYWMLYDFANTIYSMNVVSLYFALWITVDKKGEDIFYSIALSVSMIMAAILEPLTGAMSDIHGRKIPFLLVFTLVCCVATGLIGTASTLVIGLIFFAIANTAYEAANVFYNALLYDISTKENIGRISGYGVGLGYIGTIFGLLMVKPFVVAGGRQSAFIPTSILFFLFSVPCLFLIREPIPAEKKIFKIEIKKALQRIKDTFRQSQKYPGVIRFVLAAFVFFNAINTCIIFMSVYTKKVIGFSDPEMVTFYIISTTFAILGSFLFGFLTDRLGAKKALSISLGIWLTGLTIAMLTASRGIFYLVGPLVGIGLGSTWVSSRALAVQIAPEGKIGEIFGLYGLAGKSSAILGSLVWGITVLAFGFLGLFKYRIAIFVQCLFIIIGWFILRGVPYGNRHGASTVEVL
ncbi:MAG: MFS transporter [Elusimicrobiota bacterium]